ncbi:hypothetical protein [Paenibacillus sp. MBLB4367]|uniref:hypothetical protein n=1 Tax=Paenibacillus sp. MBLB4367 TaxID=3384767 RepID=UPI003907F2E8
MIRTHVQTYKHRVGKHTYLIVKIYQTATAKAKQGNVLASNAASVRIYKHRRRQKTAEG